MELPARIMSLLRAVSAVVARVLNWIAHVFGRLVPFWPVWLSLILGILALNVADAVRDLFLVDLSAWQLLLVFIAFLLLWSVPMQICVDQGLRRSRMLRKPAALIITLAGLIPPTLGLIGIGIQYAQVTRCETISGRTQLDDCVKFPVTMDVLESGEGTLRIPESAETVAAKGPLNRLALTFVLLGFAVVGTHTYWLRALRARQTATVERRWTDYVAPALTVVSIVLMAVAFALPIEVTETVGSLALVGMLCGGWLSVIEWLRRSTRWVRYSAMALGLLLLFLSAGQRNYNDVATFTSSHYDAAQAIDAPPAARRQMLIAEAVDAWMAANGCSATVRCPRPILVAAEGGATRSAYMTATTLGALLDVARADPSHFGDPAQQIFAMSGVSGGAVGLSVTRAALSEQGADGTAPCKYHPKWRDCLQDLVSADAVAPAVISVVLRDPFSVVSSGDAAQVLSWSLERHYNRETGKGSVGCADLKDETGLCAPIGYRAADSRWLPLLILNATDIDTGRPVLLSDLQTAVAECDSQTCAPLFTTAYNAFELMALDPLAEEDILPDEVTDWQSSGLERPQDIRLSTASVLSARFPFVSPAGTLHYRTSYADKVTARLVDGGYFNNSGLQAINELLPYLRKRGLEPAVLAIRATPVPWRRGYDAPGRLRGGNVDRLVWTTRERLWSPDPWHYFVKTVTEPFETLVSARQGHDELAREQLFKLRGQFGGIGLAEVNVFTPIRSFDPADAPFEPTLCEAAVPGDGEFNAIPLYPPVLSWTLSPLSQHTMDVQFCDFHNAAAMASVLRSLEVTP